jgi:hypothetical protein
MNASDQAGPPLARDHYCSNCGGAVKADTVVCPHCKCRLSGKGQGDEAHRRRLRREHRRRQAKRLGEEVRRLAPRLALGVVLVLLALVLIYSAAVRLYLVCAAVVAVVLFACLVAWSRGLTWFERVAGPWGTVALVSKFRANLTARALLRAVETGNAARTRRLLAKTEVFDTRAARRAYGELTDNIHAGHALAMTCILRAIETRQYAVLAVLCERYCNLVEDSTRLDFGPYKGDTHTPLSVARTSGDPQIVAILEKALAAKRCGIRAIFT